MIKNLHNIFFFYHTKLYFLKIWIQYQKKKKKCDFKIKKKNQIDKKQNKFRYF